MFLKNGKSYNLPWKKIDGIIGKKIREKPWLAYRAAGYPKQKPGIFIHA